MSCIQCSLGITAHNEEANIGKLLRCALEQQLSTVDLTEVIVVISGCTDNTEGIVRSYMREDGRIRLIIQPRREGKASAMNLFLQAAREDVLVLSSADILPALNTLEDLVAPFADPEVGMTAAHPIPVNDKHTFMGFTDHLLWDLHHEMNLRQFKAGEMIAFRKTFTRIPSHTAVDEASVEPLIRGQGYRLHYVPQAIISNKGPETVSDFLRQRRRIYAGHLELQRDLGYSVSTMSSLAIVPILLKNLEWRPKQLLWSLGAVTLEATGRILGWRDFKRGRDHTVWDIAGTTKELRA